MNSDLKTNQNDSILLNDFINNLISQYTIPVVVDNYIDLRENFYNQKDINKAQAG